MADLAASRTTGALRLADAVGREIVLMDVSLLGDRGEVVDDLSFRHRSQRSDGERLCLAAGEERRSVNTREQSDFTGDRADFRQLSAIRTDTFIRDGVTDDFLRQMVERICHIREMFRVNVSEMCHRFLLRSSDIAIAAQLIRIEDRLLQGLGRERFDIFFDLCRDFRESQHALFLADFFDDLLLETADFLDRLMTEHDRIEDFFLRCFLRAAFDHHDRFFRAGDRHIHRGRCHLFLCRVDDILAIHAAHADTGDRAVPRDIGNTDGRRCADHAAQLRCIVIVDREDRRYDMDIISASFIKQRTDRTVDQTRAEDRRISRTAFTAKESPRHLADSIHLLFIVDSQREEIRAFARLLARRSSDEDSGIPISDQYSAIRLLGHFTSLNDQWTTGQFHFKCFEQFLFLLSKCFFIRLFII